MLQAGTKAVAELKEHEAGDIITFTVIIKAREWQDRWFNNIDIYNMEAEEEKTEIKDYMSAKEQAMDKSRKAAAGAEGSNDLPF